MVSEGQGTDDRPAMHHRLLGLASDWNPIQPKAQADGLYLIREKMNELWVPKDFV